jgi:protein arginine kinase
VHGEGSRALGQLYQISNQRTLGSDWNSQVEAVQNFGQEVARYERETRRALLREPGPKQLLIEDFERAYEVLAKSEAISTAQALDALSILRLAVHSGLAEEMGVSLDAQLLLLNSFQLQPGHLQARIGAELPPEARDASRAHLLRESLNLG